MKKIKINEKLLNHLFEVNNIKKVRQGIIPYEADSFEIGFNGGANGYAGVVGENGEMEVTSDEVSLKSFNPHDNLNDKIWIDGKINSRVRLKLLDIADDFFNSLDLDWVKIKDVLFTGSLANYNWSKYSDIDLHLLVDFKSIDENTKLVKEFFDAQKNNWNNNHENLKIYGFPVEIYVEDTNEKHVSTGVYSLYNNKWIREPQRQENIKLDKFVIKDKAAQIMTRIDDLEDAYHGDNDAYQFEVLSKKVKTLYDKIKKMRKYGLESNGEMSPGNVIFKILRRSGYMDRLYDLKINLYDRINSIDKL